MEKVIILTICATALIGCSQPSSQGATATIMSTDTASVPSGVTRETIAKCWTSEGIPSDLYKFLTPQEALGIQKIDGASDAQINAFKSCIQSA